MVKSGDTVSLSIHPSVQVSRFFFVKASATVTRVVGDDPAEDLLAMKKDLRKLYLEAVSVEIELVNELSDAMDSEDPLAALQDYVARKTANEAPSKTSRRR